MMAVIERPGGVNAKMAKVLEKTFVKIKSIGGDIGKHKRKHTSQRTWKDSNRNTMYIYIFLSSDIDQL
jgi:hypothetical protein